MSNNDDKDDNMFVVPIINELQDYIDSKLNIEGTVFNTYIFLLMFLQRVQLINNIIKLVEPESNHSENFIFGLKYNLVYLTNYELIKNKINDFKKDFSKQDVISEILNFIKNSNIFKQSITSINNIDDIIDLNKEIKKPLLNKTKMNSIILEFQSIKKILDKIEKDKYIDEEDFSEYFILARSKTKFELSNIIYNENFARIEVEKNTLTKEWLIFVKNKDSLNYPIYQLLKKWFNLS
jgi:hypothetical protein